MIDRLARDFAQAGQQLAESLVAELEQRDPELVAKVARALEMGERMQLTLSFDPSQFEIAWLTVDDYQHAKRIMTIPGKVPARH